MRESTFKRNAWVLSFSIVTVITAILLFLPSSPLFSLTALLRTTKQIQNVATNYKLGETVVFEGEVGFLQNEIKTLNTVILDIGGPQPLRVSLPVVPGLNQNLADLLPKDPQNNPIGSLFVDVISDNLVNLAGNEGYGYNSFKGIGSGYSSKLKYVIRWTPPVFLEPRPVFALIPAFETIATIPTLEAPAGQNPAEVLPNTNLKFAIPSLGAPTGTVLPDTQFVTEIVQLTLTSSAPAEVPDLPDTTVSFDIPTVQVTGAPTGVPELPDTTAGFDIPQVTVGTAPTGVPELPDTTAAFDIPTLAVASAPTGVENLPNSALAFSIPGDAFPRGLAHDGTDFWLVIDGDPVDKVIKINASGVQQGSAIDGPSANLDGIAFLNGSLWVVENQFRCFDGNEDRCDRSHRVFKIDPNNPPVIGGGTGSVSESGDHGDSFGTATSITPGTATGTISPGTDVDFFSFTAQSGTTYIINVSLGTHPDSVLTAYDNNQFFVTENDDFPGLGRASRVTFTASATGTHYLKVRSFSTSQTGTYTLSLEEVTANPWFTNTINAPETFSEIGGISSEGTGASGTLWLSRKSGGRLFNILQDGTEINSPFTSEFIDQMNSAAFLDGFIYTTKSGTLTRWTTGAIKDKDFVTSPSRGNIQGMTFTASDSVLYMASGTDKKVYKSFVAATVTTDPRGIAFQQSGSDKFLWLLVDGDPKDKLLKINATTGALVTGFGSSGGVDAPSADTEGIVFFSNSLWVIANEGFTRKLYKVNPSNGAVQDTRDLGSDAAIFEDLGDITTDGTNLVAYARGGNAVYFINPTTFVREDLKFPCCPSFFGARGLAFHSGRAQYLGASGGKLGFYGSDLTFQKEQSFTVDSVSISGVQGLVFDSDVLYVARSGKISKGALITTITTKPRGIAFQQSGTTKILWTLVDGDPKDRLLKINADTGTLLTDFGSGSGSVNAPSDKTEGITFFSTKLWIVANEGDGRKLIKVNPSNGSVEQTFNLSGFPGGFVFEDLGDISNDGTNLLLFTSSSNHLFVVNTAGEKQDEKFPCCPSFFGAKGLAFHSGRSQLFSASGGKLATYDSAFSFVEERSLTVDTTSISGVEGLSFDGDVMYVARTGKVSKGAFVTTVTTDPRGIAFSPSSATAGRALWIVVDGNPNDKLLKVDPDSGLLITAFGTNGAVDLPGNNVQGVVFLSNKLWIIANDGFIRNLIRIKTTDGSVEETFNLSGFPNGFIFDDLGDITTDGINLIVFNTTFNKAIVIDTTGAKVEEKFPCCPSFSGARGLAFHSGRNQYFAASGGKLATLDSEFFFLKEQSLTVDSSAISGVQGLVFDSDVLYVARSGKVSKGAVRDTVSTDPRGLAFTPTGTIISGTPVGRALWVLVDGDPKDKLLKIDPDTGALLTDFSSDGATDAPSNDTQGITFLSNSLWIVANEPDGKKLFKVKPTDGSVQQTFNLTSFSGGFVFDNLGGITNNGTDLILYAEGSDHLWIVNTSGEKEDETFMPFDPNLLGGARGLAFRSSKNQLFSAKGSAIVQLAQKDDDFIRADVFTTTLTGIQGMTFVDDTLYIAHTGSGKISKAAIPSDITNNPRGLAYDGTNLFILVDGKAQDHIIVVNPTNGNQVRDFAAPDEDTDAITFLNGSLYVAVNDDDPFCCTRTIKKLNPTTGAELASVANPVVFAGDLTSMSNDGTDLIGIHEFGTTIYFIEPSDGTIEESRIMFDPSTPFFNEEGFQALAFQTTDKEFFASKGKRVFRYDVDGKKLQEFSISTSGVDNIRGATFVGSLLYLAEAGTKTIQSAGIPVPPVTITNTPRAMATDGTSLFVAVDASPKDKILKLNTQGVLQASFDSPGSETDGLAFKGTSLYVLTNDAIGLEGPRPRISRINTSTGAVLEKFNIKNPFGQGDLFEKMGGLASDGSFLYAASKQTGNLFKIDPANPGAPPVFVNQFAGILPFLPDLESAEIALNRLVVSGSTEPGGMAHMIARMDKDVGVMIDQFHIDNVDIRGLAYVGINLYMVDAEANSLIVTILPENTPEQTVIGSYAAQLEVQHNPGTELSPTTSFTIQRNPTVKVRFTQPATGFVTPSSNLLVKGQVNDHALIRAPFNKVTVAVLLPFTTLFQDNVVRPASGNLWNTNGLWHIACKQDTFAAKVGEGNCAWRYGRSGQANFDTGAANAGNLALKDPISVATGTSLSFSIWYDTEPSNDKDTKTLEIAEITKDIQGNDVVGPFKPVRQIVGFGFGNAEQPENAHQSFSFIEVPPLKFDVDPQTAQGVASFFDVFVDLTPFAGKRIKARFHFDSVDGFGNGGEGVYIDEIRISGSGATEVLADVTPLASPVTVGSDTYVGEFEATVALADGINTVKATAVQPYTPFASGQAQISGSVDSTPPSVGLSNISPTTSTLIQTLRVSVVETTFQFLEVKQTNSFGTRVISTFNVLPQNGQFNIPVFLAEGLNTFEATATDGSGLLGSGALAVRADTIKPTITIANLIAPVGEISARPNDQFIVDVTTADGLLGSGVVEVKFFTPGDQTGVLLIPASELPEAVRDRFQIKGNFAQFVTVPGTVPPGSFSLTVRAKDGAGNQSDPFATAGTVVPTLQQFNRYLMPGINFISTPLQCTGATVSLGGLCSNDGDLSFDIAALLQQVVPNANPAFDPDSNSNTPVRLADIIDTISAYDGGLSSANFKVYTTDGAADSLTKIQVLRGYIVKTKDAAFRLSAPIAVGFPQTPAPIKMTFIGLVLKAGDLPPVQHVVGAWNLVGLHSENPTKVERFVAGVSVPVRKWASLFTFQNELNFTPPTGTQDEILEIILGAFKGKFEGDFVDPGDSFWLFMIGDGDLVPVLQ